MLAETDITPRLSDCALVRVQDYNVTVKLPPGLTTPEKGQRLLDLERKLRAEVDDRIQVFLEPAQDRNAIRQFRGVKVT